MKRQEIWASKWSEWQSSFSTQIVIFHLAVILPLLTSVSLRNEDAANEQLIMEKKRI